MATIRMARVFCIEEGDSEVAPFPRSGGGAGDHGDGLGELQATSMEALSVRRREPRGGRGMAVARERKEGRARIGGAASVVVFKGL